MSSSSFDHLVFSGFLDNILIDFPPQSQPVLFSSGSDNSTRKTNSSSSGSDDGETNQCEVNNPIDDQRRQKRMVSNRESARRSRMRKQKHLQNVRGQVTRYQSSNQDLMNRLRFVNHNLQIVQRENERLGLESVILQQKLYSLNYQLLVAQELQNHAIVSYAWPCNNNVTYINDQNQPSLITY